MVFVFVVVVVVVVAKTPIIFIIAAYFK